VEYTPRCRVTPAGGAPRRCDPTDGACGERLRELTARWRRTWGRGSCRIWISLQTKAGTPGIDIAPAPLSFAAEIKAFLGVQVHFLDDGDDSDPEDEQDRDQDPGSVLTL